MSYGTVVVGYDGSADADRAVDAAADQVQAGGTVHVVTAYRPLSDAELLKYLDELPEEFRYLYAPDAAEQQRQQPAIERLARRGVACEGHVIPGEPAAVILEVAEREGAELVVVGSRGLGGVQRFLRGSVSTRIATHAPTSVLIVAGAATD